ncbi:L,D-transpeptidase [Clostridium sp. DMHC 10]|uniref:L,D-transpeptidase n=1 Tax=Clostridium sp. DMHC 10 TaxID=747377 RepID=UPI000A928316|nr:L,D-transpeptidase [Clostridium sp. DMHC 10]
MIKKSLIALGQAEKPLKVQVDLSKQRVYVYDAKSRMVEDFICSSGLEGYDTPKGEYRVKERGYSFYSEKYKEGAYYWVQFMGNYLFHSIPFDKNQVIEKEESKKTWH